jgi:hypothetical protein
MFLHPFPHVHPNGLRRYTAVSPQDAAELRALEDRVEAEVRQYRYDLWHEMDADVVRGRVTRIVPLNTNARHLSDEVMKFALTEDVGFTLIGL